MTERCYRIANTVISVRTPFDYLEDGYSSRFICEKAAPDIAYQFNYADSIKSFGSKPVFSDEKFRVYRIDGCEHRVFSWCQKDTDEMIDYACLSFCTQASEKPFNAQVTVLNDGINRFPGSYLVFNVLALEHTLLLTEKVMLHCSFVDDGDGAILFTGASGVGKSTQAALWEKFAGARIINGDRAFVSCKKGVVRAYGLPFAGSSGICKNESAAVKCIVLLKQAKANRAVLLSGAQAFKALFVSEFIDRWLPEDIGAAADITKQLVDSVPVVMLECLPERSAVDELYSALKEIN